MQTLLLATRNRRKLAELQALLDGATQACRMVTIDDLEGDMPEVDEDGDTFVANARKKAIVLAKSSGLLTLADDSGLAVDALGGDPGVRSARYAGTPCDDDRNNALLLSRLDGVIDRRARFHCVLALADPTGRCKTVSGICEGTLLAAPQGRHGFGYDPLFVPDGYERTFAEMPASEKHQISHRARALQAAISNWLHRGQFALGS
jgi:XTP/dITP diphosphohydrolase